MTVTVHKLTAPLSAEPPTEFRIFSQGKIVTTKGVFLFDEASARSVLKEYADHGIDLMIDYDHASLAALSLDPATSGKAAGWFNIAIRSGELWAVNVRWTLPAAEALRRKEWRFMSPAFQTSEDGRITSLLNVAITNLPATRNLTPLIAANTKQLGANMDPKLIAEALDALIAGDAEKSMEILKGILVAAAGGEEAKEEAEDKAEEPAAPEMPMLAAPEGEEPAEVVAAMSAISRLSGKPISASVADVEEWRASHLELAAARKKIEDERAVLESAERRRGCVDLVTLGGRSPATVWADDKCSAPKQYLLAMPMSDFRDYVADQLKSSSKPSAVKAPVALSAPAGKEFSTRHGVVTLSTREINECVKLGVRPETYAENKAYQNKARTGGKE